MDVVDLTTLGTTLPRPIVGDSGLASAVVFAKNGDLLVAGVDPRVMAVWLARYDASGAPVWPRRAESRDSALFAQVTTVAEQSSGAIAVSTTLGTALLRCAPGEDR